MYFWYKTEWYALVLKVRHNCVTFLMESILLYELYNSSNSYDKIMCWMIIDTCSKDWKVKSFRDILLSSYEKYDFQISLTNLMYYRI